MDKNQQSTEEFVEQPRESVEEVVEAVRHSESSQTGSTPENLIDEVHTDDPAPDEGSGDLLPSELDLQAEK